MVRKRIHQKTEAEDRTVTILMNIIVNVSKNTVTTGISERIIPP